MKSKIFYLALILILATSQSFSQRMHGSEIFEDNEMDYKPKYDQTQAFIGLSVTGVGLVVGGMRPFYNEENDWMGLEGIFYTGAGIILTACGIIIILTSKKHSSKKSVRHIEETSLNSIPSSHKLNKEEYLIELKTSGAGLGIYYTF